MDDQNTPSPDENNPLIHRGLFRLERFWAELRRRKVIRVAMTYTVVGWLIIQVADATFENFGIPLWAYVFVVMLLLLGFPIALIIAWAFELTPDGLKTTRHAQEERGGLPVSERHERKRNWLSFLFGATVPTVIFSTMALIFYFRTNNEAETTIWEKSIAVIPFENRSNREEDQFFTDGIHDDLLTQISRIEDIITKSRTSVVVYRNTTKNMTTIGEELGVSWILEGGVQRGGEQIRINVRLTDVATDSQVWAQNYTHEMTAENVFQIQSEIVTLIAESLKAVISPEDKRRIQKSPTENMAALEAYFRGKNSQEDKSMAGLTDALVHFGRAIDLDPDFALAYVWTGRTLLNQIRSGGLSAEEQTEKAEPYILKALELDPGLSEAYTSLGLLRDFQGYNEGADLAFSKAIELDPENVDAYQTYHAFLRFRLKDIGKALKALREAYDLNPDSEEAQSVLVEILAESGEWEEARKLLEVIVRKNPDNAVAQFRLGKFYFDKLRQFDEAIIAFRKFHHLDPVNPFAVDEISDLYRSLGDFEQATWWADRFIKIQEDPALKAWKSAWKNLYAKNHIAREQSALDGLRVNPSSHSLLWHLTEIYLASNEPQRALVYYKTAYPQLFDSSATFEAKDVWAAKDIARLLLASGEENQARFLIEESLKLTRQDELRVAMPALIYIEAMLLAIAGENEEAIAAIKHYLDTGGSPYRVTLGSELNSLNDEPVYVELMAQAERRMSSQLERVRALEVKGELAPIPLISDS